MTVPPGSRFAATTPEQLPGLITRFVLARASGRPQRVAVDGPAAAGPVTLAEAVAETLRGAGTAATVIDAATFWRDASVRLEHGRTDVDAYARDWLDTGALTREVLDPLGPGGDRRFLVALRDPVTNRSRREPYRTAGPDEVVLVAGELLLGAGLGFDRTVHLSLSPPARSRRTRADWSWTLPAHDAYDADVNPSRTADLVVRWNDPQHPAVLVRADTDTR